MDLFPPDTVGPEGYPTDPGSYNVTFELQTRSDEQGRVDFDLGTVDEECVGYTVEIRAGQNGHAPPVNVFPNSGCDQGRMGEETS